MAWLGTIHYRPWLSFHAEMWAFLAMGLLLLGSLFERPATSRQVDGVSLGSIILTSLLALAAVSQWAGLHIPSDVGAERSWLLRDYQSLGLIYLAAFVLVVLVAERSARLGFSPVLDWLVLALLLGGLGTALLVLRQWLTIVSPPLGLASDLLLLPEPRWRPFGHLRQPNLASTVMAMAIVAAWLAWQQGALRRWLFLVAVLWLAIAMLMTGSRTGLLQLLFMEAVAAVLAWRQQRRWLLGLMLLAMMVSSGLALSMPQLRVMLLYVPGSVGAAIGVDDGGSIAARIEIYRTALAAIAQAPWLGHGLGLGNWAYLEGLRARHWPEGAYVVGFSPYAHNMALDLALWFGIPVALLVLVLLAWFGWRALVQAPDASTRLLAVLVGVFAIHSMLELPHSELRVSLPALLALGLLLGSFSAVSFLRRGFMAGLLIVVSILSFVIARDYLLVEEGQRKMRTDINLVGKSSIDMEVDLWLLRGWQVWFSASSARVNTSNELLADAWIFQGYRLTGWRLIRQLEQSGLCEQANQWRYVDRVMYREPTPGPWVPRRGGGC